MKIAIIGGSGFIGSYLGRALHEKGIDFKIIDIHPSSIHQARWVYGDVRDTQQLSPLLSDCQVIINLAAEHKDNVTPVSLYDEVNVDGAAALCKAAEAAGIKKIIFTSSVAVYGLPVNETDESGAFNHFNDYGRTKLLAEKVYESWFHAAQDRSLIVIRPTVVFGPGNRGNVYNLLKQVASNWFMMIGHGDNRKSMVYVGTVVALLIHSLGLQGHVITNCVDKPDYSMNELVRFVRRTMGKSEKIQVRIPMFVGMVIGGILDVVSKLSGVKFPVSRVRVQKFCASTQFKANGFEKIGFKSPYAIEDSLRVTVEAEFGVSRHV
ncbi:MAG: NAD-dependent epimerase/dehydratase family protein [Cyclobacteriaceae bacterium]